VRSAPSAEHARRRRSGEWSDDDYDVLADGVVVGRESCSGPAFEEEYFRRPLPASSS
jgi:hypothetical protein